MQHVDISEIEQLVDLVKRSGLRELTLRQGEASIKLKSAATDFDFEHSGELVPFENTYDEYRQTGSIFSHSGDADATNDEARIEHITAPLVGVFHHIKPLVGPGAAVQTGQVVAVIEAMNLTTDVTSPADGVVIETTIKDGMPAEYGQTLFLLQTSAG